ncbi:hypothetical protein R0G64_32255, partial [Pseudomonas otitidis]
WRHVYGNVDSSTRQAFLSGGNAFRVEGTALDRNSLLVNLSFIDPVHKGPPAAEFDGESRLRDRFLERLSE